MPIFVVNTLLLHVKLVENLKNSFSFFDFDTYDVNPRKGLFTRFFDHEGKKTFKEDFPTDYIFRIQYECFQINEKQNLVI